MAARIAGISANAACSPCSRYTRAPRLISCTAKRRQRADFGGDGLRALHLLAGRHDFLHEADLQRARRAEFVGPQQVVHRVAPARAFDITHVRAAEDGETALRFHLAEAAIVGGDDDVGGEHHLDADRERDALHRHDDRFAATARATRRRRRGVRRGVAALRRERRSEPRQIEPGRGVRTCERQRRRPRGPGLRRAAVMASDSASNISGVKPFILPRSIDGDREHVTGALAAHLTEIVGRAHRPAPFWRSISSSTSRNRSLPKYNSVPTKKLGEPNTPRATASSTLAISCCFTSGCWVPARIASASRPDSVERGGDHRRIVHLLRLRPHVPVHRIDITFEKSFALCEHRAAHDRERIHRKKRVRRVVRDVVFLQEAPRFELRVLRLVLDALQRHRGRHVVGRFEHAAEQYRHVFELHAGARLDTRNHEVAEVRIRAAEVEQELALIAMVGLLIVP